MHKTKKCWSCGYEARCRCPGPHEIELLLCEACAPHWKELPAPPREHVLGTNNHAPCTRKWPHAGPCAHPPLPLSVKKVTAPSECETGWLIEIQIAGRAVWWAPFVSACRQWTTDSAVAVRFSRKDDAEAMIRFVNLVAPGEMRGAIATEHMWTNLEPPAVKLRRMKCGNCGERKGATTEELPRIRYCSRCGQETQHVESES